MKYRRKPGNLVEAVQWFQGDEPQPMVGRDDAGYYVTTIHDQRAYLKDGDWILPEPNGVNFYPCKPDIFAATYEPVVADEPMPPMRAELLEEDGADEAFMSGEQWTEAEIAAMRQPPLRVTKDQELEMERILRDSPPGHIVPVPRMRAEQLEDIEAVEPGPAGIVFDQGDGLVMENPVDATGHVRCEFCDKRVANPCATPEYAGGCELPPRRGEPIGQAVNIPPDHPQHPAQRDERLIEILTGVMNGTSRENGSDTPDFILGKFLVDCLSAFDHAVRKRSVWYGGRDRIGAGNELKQAQHRISYLEAKLKAEGEHTEAACAEVDRLVR